MKETVTPENTQKFFNPSTAKWINLSPQLPNGSGEDAKKKIISDTEEKKESLKNTLLTSLQMQNLVILAGSGTSCCVGGPSMQGLWDSAVETAVNKDAILTKVHYTETASPNIEELLSNCEAFLQVNADKDVSDFSASCRKIILERCSSFLGTANLEGHKVFLHRLSRRRVRDARLKIFTTNYDLCFEKAASDIGLVVLDGFSFAYPRTYDPRYFTYDIVRRPRIGEDLGNYLEGVFQLYKLHGSVNWARSGARGERIEIKEKPGPQEACLIYPAKGKYQQTYIQPHLELFAQYFTSLREPNTCLILSGFGFNDDHISEPILSAVKTNPHLRLVVVDKSAEEKAVAGSNQYWKELYKLAQKQADVWFVNASFQDFAQLIPDLKSLTPAERLAKDIKGISR